VLLYEMIAGRRPFTGDSRASLMAAIYVNSESVSRRHARIRIAAGRATIEGLDSKNGTFLGNRRIVGPTVLENVTSSASDPSSCGLRSSGRRRRRRRNGSKAESWSDLRIAGDVRLDRRHRTKR